MRVAITLVAVALSFAAACKNDSGAEDAIARMTRFRDAVCACKHRSCVDKVSQELTRSAAEHQPTTEKLSAEDQNKLAEVSNEMIKCMTRIASEAVASGAMAGSAPPGPAEGAAATGSGADTATAGGSGASPGAGGTMAHRAGNCPSTVLGATTRAAVKGRSIALTVEATDKDAIAAIQKRAGELLAEKQDAVIGSAHDMKGTYGGSRGLCPVYLPEGATAAVTRKARGVVVTITPRDKPDELAKEIENRIARAADWVKANVPPGDQGNQGGVGGGKGEDGSNHSGKGDGKGRERRREGGGGGMGTGGGGGMGTGGGGGMGTGGGGGKGGGSAKGGGNEGGAGSGGW